jgi:proline-specific peptidase
MNRQLNNIFRRRHKMAIVKVGDFNIYYEVHGKGEPLVLLPPYTSHSIVWARQVPFFAQNYQVISVDNRGAGRSDKPDPPYTIEMMTEDLATTLETIGVKKAHLFGISMGGAIAQQFALIYPEKVMSLILASTFASQFGPHYVIQSAEAMSFLYDMERRKKLTPQELAKEQLRLNFSPAFVNYVLNNPAVLSRLTADEYAAPLHGIMGQATALKRFDIYERLPEIQAPSLVIHGDSDRLDPIGNAHILASRIPHAELVILKNAGHMCIMDSAEETNTVVMNFLKQHQEGH